jgi:hypothetical protein
MIPTRCRFPGPADASLTDSWDSLVKLAASGAGWPPPAPEGMWAAGPDDLAGEGEELGRVLARVPTGRLVVLGDPGAGKTMLMVRLVLDLLARRAVGGPVPILAPVASWNPVDQDLRVWLVARLLIDHPALADPPPAGRTESTLAEALLASRLILPILDGLDEIPDEIRGSAIIRINDALQPGEHMVVTCRTQQYRDAIRPHTGAEVTFSGAAAVQLRPLAADAVGHYLCDSAGGPVARARWTPVLAVLGTEVPAGQALSTPLMVGLARAIYNPRPGEPAGAPRDPAELCSPALADRAAVESLLFDAYIPAAYRHDPAGRWKAHDVERWLVFLARHLEYTIRGPDLAWWQLARSTPRVVTGVATGLITGLVTGLAIEIALVIMTAASGALGWLWFAVPTVGLAAVTGLKVAPIGGLAAGLLCGVAAAVAARDDQRLAPVTRWSSHARAVSRAAASVIVGVMVGVAAWFWYPRWLAVGLGILAGILVTVSGLRADRRGKSEDFRRALAAGIVVGVLVGLTFGVLDGVLVGYVQGLRWGITWGVVAGLAAAAGAILKGAHGERPARGARWNLRKGLLAAAVAGTAAAVLTVLGGGSAFGLSFGLIFGLTGGIAAGAVAGLEGVPDDLTTGASPPAVLARDRGATLLLTLVTGVSAGIAAGIVADAIEFSSLAPGSFLPTLPGATQGALSFGLGMGISAGLTIGAGFGLAVSGFGSAWPSWLIARGRMALSGRLPLQLVSFLDDAHRRGVLRRTGAVYQFRHIELQHRLATRP